MRRLLVTAPLCIRRPLAGVQVGAAVFLHNAMRGMITPSTGVAGTSTSSDLTHMTAFDDHQSSANVPSNTLYEGETDEEQYGGDGFDELEAASQELHDLSYAIISFLRRADPEANSALFERRVKRRFRESKPEHQRRLLHGHGERSLRRRNNFASQKDFEEATKLYVEWGEKLLLLLNKPALDRIIHSAGKGHRDLRMDGVHRYRNQMERATWRSFPHRWFKHAPFEVQQLRADIPKSAVENTRFYRDFATLRYLFTLMEPQHPYRQRIEQRMFKLTSAYDPAHPPLKSDG